MPERSGPLSAPSSLPNARDAIETVVSGHPVAVFLDYDGTLTPIVERPEDAVMSEAMRETVAHLASLCPVVIVSGRDRADVQERVAIETIAYAGSHGFDTLKADGTRLSTPGEEHLSDLKAYADALEQQLADIPNAEVERKRYALAVHFRRVSPESQDEVRRQVRELIAPYEGRLQAHEGKKVFDVKPDVDWHKGRAVEALLEALERERGELTPLYIGDDVTDEDAFAALQERGVGIIVRERPERSTLARYELRDSEEVRTFLRELAERLSTSRG